MSHVCGEPQLPVSLREPGSVSCLWGTPAPCEPEGTGKSVSRVKEQTQCCLEERVEKGSEPGHPHGKENPLTHF